MLKGSVYDHGMQLFDLLSVYRDGTFRWIINPTDFNDDAYGIWIKGTWVVNENELTLIPEQVDADTRAQIDNKLRTGDIPVMYSNRIDRLFERRSFHMQYSENGSRTALVDSSSESPQWLGKGYPPGPMSFEPDGPR